MVMAEVGPLDGILVLEVANWWALLPLAVQLTAAPALLYIRLAGWHSILEWLWFQYN